MNQIEYHPYRRYIWFAIPQCFLAICGFVGVGLAYPHLGKVLVFLVLFSGYLFGSAMYFFGQSLVTAFIDRNGVLLLQGMNRCNRYVSWVEAPYSYLCRNFKGHRFWVLSQIKLDAKQAQYYIGNWKRGYKDQIIVIYLDPGQSVTKQVEEAIANSGNELCEFN